MNYSKYLTNISKICKFVGIMSNILYIHGMGGGGDSRIPSILSEELTVAGVSIHVRTYDFDPDIAARQIAGWVDELNPDLIIGESLGSLHALRITGRPLLFVSPALNAPYYFELLAWLALIPGVTWIFDRIYKPREGDRQNLHFTFKVLRKYLPHRKSALDSGLQSVETGYLHAFFGVNDHYMDSGIVSVKTWRKYFGYNYSLYEGTHFMEEGFVRTLLKDTILDILYNNM